jgi:hypothetical protein
MCVLSADDGGPLTLAGRKKILTNIFTFILILYGYTRLLTQLAMLGLCGDG